MITKNRRVFYGHAIEEGAKGTLAEQAYAILLREILAGRWGVGEKLPSYAELASMSGISRNPMEVALGRLERDGYLEKISKKGTFLKSACVDDRLGVGLITLVYHSGLVNCEKNIVYTQTFGNVSVAGLMGEFSRHGFSIEVIDLAGDRRAIGDQTQGIVSLADHDTLLASGLDTRAAPVVYVGTDDVRSVPCIAGDPAYAMHMLTAEVIRRGHTKIAVFAPYDWEHGILERSLDAHRTAMAVAGLLVDESLIEMSRAFTVNSLPDVKRFLGALDGHTALICMKNDIVLKVFDLAQLMEIDVPGDLSLVSLQATYHDEFFAASYDWVEVYTLCSELLKRDDRGLLNRFVMKPFIMEGVTLASVNAEEGA